MKWPRGGKESVLRKGGEKRKPKSSHAWRREHVTIALVTSSHKREGASKEAELGKK